VKDKKEKIFLKNIFQIFINHELARSLKSLLKDGKIEKNHTTPFFDNFKNL
jgi:hypothetical protein